MRYLKIFGYEWLEGSIRRDLDSAGRGVWADVLALGSMARRIGYLERSEGIPYTDKELADKFCIGEKELQQVFATCILEGRLSTLPDGTYYVTNWDRYQDYPLGSNPTSERADRSKPYSEKKQVGIQKAKETKQRKDAVTDATLRAVNATNKELAELNKKTRYLDRGDGKILDTETGEVEVEE